MEQGARRVDHRQKRWLSIQLDASLDLRQNRVVVHPGFGSELAVCDGDAEALEHVAATPCDILTTETREPDVSPGMREQPIYRWQFAQPGSCLAHRDEARTLEDDFQQPAAIVDALGLSTGDPIGPP